MSRIETFFGPFFWMIAGAWSEPIEIVAAVELLLSSHTPSFNQLELPIVPIYCLAICDSFYFSTLAYDLAIVGRLFSLRYPDANGN